MKQLYDWSEIKEAVESGNIDRFYYVWEWSALNMILSVITVRPDHYWSGKALFGCDWVNKCGDYVYATGAIELNDAAGMRLDTQEDREHLFINFWYAYAYWLRMEREYGKQRSNQR